MGRFLLGVLLGLAVAGMAWGFLGCPVPPTRAPEGPPRRPSSRMPAELAAPSPLAGRVSNRPATPRLSMVFPEGTAVLRIGDGYVFGEDRVQGEGDASAADLICLDLRESAHFACPHGAEVVLLPVVTTREAPTPETTWRFTADAPTALTLSKLELAPAATHEHSGVGLVQADDGVVYRVFVHALEQADLALERFVEIRYARVERREGGGIARIPGTAVGTRVDAARARAIVSALTRPSGVPNRIRLYVLERGGFVAVPALDPENPLERSQRLVLQGDLAGPLRVSAAAALVIEGDVSSGGGIASDTPGFALLVEGDLCGTVKVMNAVVRVRGDLLGNLVVEGVSNVVIDGDVLGTLEMDGICSALIRGRIRNRETGLELQGIHTVYLAGFTGKDAFPSPARDLNRAGSNTLHLEDSDLPRKKREHWPRRLAGWSDVIVGDSLWEKMGD